MPPRAPLRRGAVLVLLALSACTPAADPTTVAPAPTTTVAATGSTVGTTSTTAAPVSTEPADATVRALVSRYSEMGPGWSELFFPYGDTDEWLGTSPGGEGLMLGPDYGTQTPDGSWWFLDAARLRIARFDREGGYIEDYPIPEDLLVDGIYFQFQMPQALDDGSIAVGGFDRPLLRIVDGEIFGLPVAGGIPWETTDGVSLYGLSIEDGRPTRADPDDPVVEPVEWFRTRDGSRFRITLAGGEMIVELPDTGVTRTIQLGFAEDPATPVMGGIEVESGVDGTLFILVNGVPVSDETLGVGGILTVGPDGEVGPMEAVIDPFSPSDPGSPAHLGVTPGTSDPWYMVIGDDGVRVFRRDA